MTSRDRIVVLVVAFAAIVGGFWFGLLNPRRQEAARLNTQLTEARQRLDQANQTAASAKSAQASYASDYATVARLGKAVPADDDTPSLVYQLQSAAAASHVDFRSIELSPNAGAPAPTATPAAQVAAVGQAQKGGTGTTPAPASGSAPASGGSGSTPATAPSGSAAPGATGTPVAATQAAAATLPPGAAVGPAGFPTMPFDFAFEGSFFRLEDFLQRLDRFTAVHGDQIAVRGRLMSVDGIALAAGPKGFPQMKASIHATAYLLPADQGLTNGATADQPATGTATAAGGSGASPAAAAVVTGVTK